MRRKQIRKMAGETENVGMIEFSIRIRDQNRLTKKPHTGTHMPVAIPLHLKKALIGSE